MLFVFLDLPFNSIRNKRAYFEEVEDKREYGNNQFKQIQKWVNLLITLIFAFQIKIINEKFKIPENCRNYYGTIVSSYKHVGL